MQPDKVPHPMPREFFRKFQPIARKLRGSWYFKLLGPRITDARLWGLNRRAITSAFGSGIAISFIPLPIHLPVGLAAAVIWRLNVPAMVGTLLLLNPFTALPVYYAAYRVGAMLLGVPVGGFAFELSWDWLQTGLGGIWKPFLLGCLVCSVLGGYFAYRALELVWRLSTVSRLNARRNQVRDQ
jgi:uncharacterized protein (DUF2062 family)